MPKTYEQFADGSLIISELDAGGKPVGSWQVPINQVEAHTRAMTAGQIFADASAGTRSAALDAAADYRRRREQDAKNR